MYSGNTTRVERKESIFFFSSTQLQNTDWQGSISIHWMKHWKCSPNLGRWKSQ